MNKGQIFSVDMLFGVIILIFGIGLLIGACEINFYNYKQAEENKEITTKAIIGAQIITNSNEWDCNFSDTHLAYSINLDKFKLVSKEYIKQKTNLSGYNARVLIGSEVIYEDNIENTNNLYSVDLNLLVCSNTTDFNTLKNCMLQGDACMVLDQNLTKQTFRLEVAK